MKKRYIILYILLVSLLVIVSTSATTKREVYDYQGSGARFKINYTLFEAGNVSGTNFVCIAGDCRAVWPVGENASFNQSFTDERYIQFANESFLDVNSANNWITNLGNLTNVNSTQMENNNGELNIKESWFTILWNTIFGTKDTDDLTEGTSNLYDNQTWNEVYSRGVLEGSLNSTSWNRSGTDVFLANSGDSVGIGTGSPNYNLEVTGNFSANSSLFVGTDGRVGIGTSSPEVTLDIIDGDISISNSQTYSIRDTGGIRRGILALDISNRVRLNSRGSQAFIELTDSDGIAFKTGTVQNRMNIDEDGNVGIGTTSPNTELEVNGSITLTEDSNKIFLGTAQDVSINYNGSQTQFTNEVGSGEFVFPTGKVGIGTSSPQDSLHIIGGNIRLENGQSLDMIRNTASAKIDVLKIASGTDKLVMKLPTSTSSTLAYEIVNSGDNNLFSILGGGNVGIGTASPNRIGFNHVFTIESTTDASQMIEFVLNSNSITDGQQQGLSFITGTAFNRIVEVTGRTDGTDENSGYLRIDTMNAGVRGERFRITKEGYVGIGTTTPDTPLEVSGTAGRIVRITPTGESINSDTYMSFNSDRAFVGYGDANLIIQGTSGKGIELNVDSGAFGEGTAITILSSRNVGIGTIAPNTTLQVNGTISSGNITATTPSTFSLGSSLVRWLKGWFVDLDVSGLLNNTGNASINNYYGEIYMHNDTSFITTVINTQNVWENVTGFNSSSLAVTGQTLNGFSWDDAQEKLITLIAGKYKVDYSFSFGNIGNNQEYQLMMAIDDVRQEQTDSHRKVGSAGDVGNIGSSGFIDLNVGDGVHLQVINRDGTGNVQVHAANVNLFRIGL